MVPAPPRIIPEQILAAGLTPLAREAVDARTPLPGVRLALRLSPAAARLVERFRRVELSRAWISDDYRLGCPVSVVTLEAGADNERLRNACATAFESWISPTAALLEVNGLPVDDARRLATVVVSTIEGAVIVARALRSTDPLAAAAEVVADLIAQRCRATGGAR